MMMMMITDVLKRLGTRWTAATDGWKGHAVMRGGMLPVTIGNFYPNMP